MPDFKSMTPEELAAWCKDQGQPAFRGKQLFQWLHRGVTSTQEMTDLPKAFRAIIDQAGGGALPHSGQKTGLKAGRHHKISLETARRPLH